MSALHKVIKQTEQGARIGVEEALSLADSHDLRSLMETAARIRDRGHPAIVSYSPKIFIPLVQLCRDVCHYCTFVQTPRRGQKAYLSPEKVLEIARAGAKAGCHEALFTLGDKPELRYQSVRDELHELGHTSTLSYLSEMAQLILDETGLLPHLNPGVMSHDDLLVLRKVSVSQGLMLESISQRLCGKGGPHYGSPDKQPAARLACIAAAGATRVPFTSGILIGIGETRHERIESLLALRELHDADGHLQEIIVQNFRRKANTRMGGAPEPALEELLWTVSIARIIFGPSMNIQAPPNLTPHALPELIRAGINDWGGVSPVTPDYVNPEAPWPQLEDLAGATATVGKQLAARLPIYPEYLKRLDQWVDPALHTRVLRCADAEGYARSDSWSPGAGRRIPTFRPVKTPPGFSSLMSPIVDKAMNKKRLDERETATLFNARGSDFEVVCRTADELRAEVNGDTVTYVVNRNINYTNICSFSCGFCAFSKGHVSQDLRERGYNLPLDQIQQRTREAWQRGAVEVCLQGGIHPHYTGETYLSITQAVKRANPEMHVHAFSPLEVSHGAATLGMTVEAYLQELKQAGLGTLPGTAAEILDDEVRRIICPDKLNTKQWLDVIRTAHSVGLTTTATIMFGHVDTPTHWARHLLRLRDLQEETGGITEFVPLPFVHMEAPLYRRGMSRRGPTFREAVLMHAVARLVLYPHINNIQASWVKMGHDGVKVCLRAGVNDLGGTLMNESISRAAGANHGQECSPDEMERLIREAGRTPRQRTSTYGEPLAERRAASFLAAPLDALPVH
ncbi:MAG: 5-amino-6-(D-ribitylamino)uracil--L-tyrosine 4-hydroxyphenyl transferase CofH [Gammaproteobacteria bacterium]